MPSVDTQTTTPYGMWQYGNAFRLAAVAVLSKHIDRPFTPYYFLVGQSIEVLLKAFLLGRGVDLAQLRRNFGHDLQALLKEARRRRLSYEVKLESKHVGVICLLSMEYKRRRFQYHESGIMYLPEIQFLDEANDKLARGLEPYCRKVTKAKLISGKTLKKDSQTLRAS